MTTPYFMVSHSLSDLAKLQSVHCATALIVLQSHLNTESHEILHWLPVDLRIAQTSYLLPLFLCIVPLVSDAPLLIQPSVSVAAGSRAFRSAAPNIWNPLSSAVRIAGESLTSFRS
jgi:hypothetical protein